MPQMKGDIADFHLDMKCRKSYFSFWLFANIVRKFRLVLKFNKIEENQNFRKKTFLRQCLNTNGAFHL